MRKIFRITKNVLTFGLTESIMNMKWMEVYVVARTGRPKSENPKKTLIGLKLTEEEAAKLREYASKHDMTITQVLQRGMKSLSLRKETRWRNQERITKEGF